MTGLHTSRLWSISDAGEQDKAQIKALFAEVFEQPMSEELWQWKYGDGRGVAVVAKRDDQVIAHYGGIVREVCFQGERRNSIQCVDTMVKPTERGTLARKGPYFLVARAFLERYVGYDRPFEFGYGFPNRRVMKLGERVGIQASVGDVLEPVWSPMKESKCEDEEFDLDNAQHRQIADELFVEMCNELTESIVGVRDATYLRHRYINNPAHNYSLKLVSNEPGGQTLGIIVFRVENQRQLLLDLIGAPAAFPALIDQARWHCGQNDAYEMSAWITAAHLDLLGGAWGRLDDPQVRIPTSVCTDGPSPESLYNKWFLTAGDTEFK